MAQKDSLGCRLLSRIILASCLCSFECVSRHLPDVAMCLFAFAVLVVGAAALQHAQPVFCTRD